MPADLHARVTATILQQLDTADPEAWHGLAANLLMLLALFHAAAALVHHYLWHDAILRRMLPRRG